MNTPTTTTTSLHALQAAAAASMVAARLGGLDPSTELELTTAEKAEMLPAAIELMVAALAELMGDQAHEYAQGLAMDLLGGALLALPPLKPATP